MRVIASCSRDGWKPDGRDFDSDNASVVTFRSRWGRTSADSDSGTDNEADNASRASAVSCRNEGTTTSDNVFTQMVCAAGPIFRAWLNRHRIAENVLVG